MARTYYIWWLIVLPGDEFVSVNLICCFTDAIIWTNIEDKL